MIKGDQKVQKSKVLNFYLKFDLYLPRGFLPACFFFIADLTCLYGFRDKKNRKGTLFLTVIHLLNESRIQHLNNGYRFWGNAWIL
jgi:hypothetical protein